jgi:muramidase (phage lysozyme)
MHDRYTPIFLVVAALGFGGCSGAEGNLEGSDPDSESAIRAANGNEIVTTTAATFVKSSTRDSSELGEPDKCEIPKGTRITLASPSVVGRHVQGRLAAAIPACGSKAAFAVGRTVFVFRDHFGDWSPTAAPTNPSALPTCSPSRAAGVVGKFPKGLLDTIAFAEGTRGRSQDGYDVIFTYRYFTNCDRHPRQRACSGSLCSDAAGRYQFLSTTWDGIKLPSFNPENQERGAIKLVEWRGVSIPANRAMTATEFSNAMSKISYEWASLPPGRYGQPSYSLTRMRTEYCSLLGC